jgi:uncharacterized protein
MDNEILRAMRQAIKSGNLKLVKEMIEEYEGLKNEVTGFGTWLHVAAKHGELDIVKYLVAIGLDVNQSGDIAECGPIRGAAGKGHLEIVQYLYESGAEFDISSADKNPLFSAIHNDHFDVAKFLIDNGIDITVGYDIGTLKNADACEYARQFGRNRIRDYLLEKLGRK